MHKSVQCVNWLHSVILLMALRCDKVGGLADHSERVNVLVQAELLETNASFLQALDIAEVRLEIGLEVRRQHLVHLRKSFLVVIRRKFGFVLNQHAVFAHLVHLVSWDLAALVRKHLLLDAQVRLVTNVHLIFVHFVRLLHDLQLVGEREVLLVAGEYLVVRL